MAADAELGASVATYRTNNRRRASIALILLPAGAVVTTVGVLLWIVTAQIAGRSTPSAADPQLVPSLVIGFGAGFLVLSGVFVALYHTHRNESFQLYEYGLAHRRGGRSVTARWADIASVTVRPTKDNSLTRWTGGDLYCTVKLADGRKVTINGLTENARHLVQTVRSHGD